jgi:hypothetical protein
MCMKSSATHRMDYGMTGDPSRLPRVEAPLPLFSPIPMPALSYGRSRWHHTARDEGDSSINGVNARFVSSHTIAD